MKKSVKIEKKILAKNKFLKNFIIIGVVVLILFFSLVLTANKNISSNAIKDFTITDKNKHTYFDYAYSVLDDYFGEEIDFNREINEIKDYNKIYISLMNGNQLRCSQSGNTKKDNLKRTKLDIQEAVEKCINDKRFGGVLKEEETKNIEIVLDILFNERKINNNFNVLKKEIELGIHSIKIKNGEKSAYFKASVPITKDYDLKKTLEQLCKKAGLKENCYTNDKTEIYIYNTLTFKGNRKEVIDLYRYNLLIETENINNGLLYERLKLSKNWFLNNINNKTKTLEYIYYPSIDKYPLSNNHVRQLATLWSATELKNFLDDSSFDFFIKNTLDYYLNYKICEKDFCYLEINKDAKLAYNAFLILSLVNVPEYKDRERLLEKFANGILNQQNKDGSYKTYFNRNTNSGIDYYPGEAMLALMKLYEKTKDSRYLESVKRAFPYYKEYWKNNKNTAFIPWHSQTYLLLYQNIEDEKLKEEIADFVFEMNDWLIDNYQITKSEFADEIGAFGKPKPTASTSAYLEGINDAYTLAKIVGDEKHELKYKDSIKKGIRFVLQTQYTPKNSFYLKAPEKAIGGFKKSLTNNYIRNDFVQHSISSIMKAYKNNVFDSETGKSGNVRKKEDSEFIDIKLIIQKIEDGKEYLIRMMDNEIYGAHKYYYPVEDKFENKSYTIYTSSALYTLLKYYDFSKDENILNHVFNGSKFILFMQNKNETKHYGAFYYSYSSDKKEKEERFVVGTTSKTIFTLLELYNRTGNSEYLESAKLGADWLIKMQNSDGSMRPYAEYKNNKWVYSTKNSHLYNGQSLSALSRIYKVTEKREYYDSAEKIAEYNIKKVKKEGCYLGDDYREKNPISSSWVIMSLLDFYKISQNENYKNIIFKCTDELLERQKESGSFEGSFSTSGNGWLAEVIVEVYKFCNNQNKKDCDKYKNSAIKAMKWVIERTYNKENSAGLKKPEIAIGGVYWNNENKYIRTDSVAHALNAYIGLINDIK